MNMKQEIKEFSERLYNHSKLLYNNLYENFNQHVLYILNS